MLKLAVVADGRLTANGQATTIQILPPLLNEVHKQHGEVWCYREAGDQEPPPIAMEVMQAIIAARLGVRLSGRADYSVFVGPDGKPILP